MYKNALWYTIFGKKKQTQTKKKYRLLSLAYSFFLWIYVSIDTVIMYFVHLIDRTTQSWVVLSIRSLRSNSRRKEVPSKQPLKPSTLLRLWLQSNTTAGETSSQYGDKDDIKSNYRFFFIYLIYGPGLKVLIIWLLLILSCWSAPFLMTEPTWVWTAVKTNVWYSKDFYLCFLFLIETFQVVLAITSPSTINTIWFL